MDINEKIRYTREYRNVTKEQLAEHIGIALKTLANFESGVRNMNPSMLKAVSKFLNVPIGFYFDEDSSSLEEFCKGRNVDQFMADYDKYKEFFKMLDLAAVQEVSLEEFKAFLEMRQKIVESVKGK